MAHRASRFLRVGDVIALFIELGCELRVAEATVELEDGDCFNARYLLNTASGAFVPLVDLKDDDSVSELEVAFWERRLGLELPGPENTN